MKIFAVTVLLVFFLGCKTQQNAPTTTTSDNADYAVMSPKAVVAPMAYQARTDTNTVQLPNPMPTWGGCSGIGKTYTNPAFPGTTYVRLTDCTTARAIKAKGSLQTADSGEQQLTAVDGMHTLVRDTGAYSYVLGFNPATKTVAATGIGIVNAAPGFSKTNPMAIRTLVGTQIHELIARSDWSGIASDTMLYDFANAQCLGAGFKATWTAIFTTSDDDATFKTGFSNTGGQGSGFYTVVWSKAKGCTVYDSLHGTVSVNGASIGSVDNGGSPGSPLVDRFYIHEGGNGRNPGFAMVTATQKTTGGKPGCVAGKCLVDMPYVWEAYTTHVRPCRNSCDGHSTKGPNGFYTGKKQVYHLYSNPDKPLTAMMKAPIGLPDQHGSAINQTTTQPFFLGTTAVPKAKLPYPVWGYDEVLAVTADGSLTVYRVGQTMNSGTSPYFIVQNATAVVDPPGLVVYITSDMGGKGALGYEADGKTSRGDVFAMVLTAK